MKKISMAVATCFLIFTAFPFVWAQDFDVSTVQELQDALDKASCNGEDDKIFIAPGTYLVNETLYYGADDCDGKLVLNAEDSKDPPILDGQRQFQIMFLDNDADDDNDSSGDCGFELAHLVFKNGYSTNNKGGGLRINDGEVWIEQCSFYGNVSDTDGGGLFVSNPAGSI